MSRGRLNKEPELVLEQELCVEAGKLNVKVTGKCGRSYYLSVDDWKALKKRVDRAIARAKKRPLSDFVPELKKAETEDPWDEAYREMRELSAPTLRRWALQAKSDKNAEPI